MTVVALCFVSFGGGWLLGYVLGWNAGTKDTERRWSDAVGRAGHR
jgi:hypothetical protein